MWKETAEAIAEASELARRPDVDVVPTTPDEPNLLASRRSRLLRRLFMAALVAFLAFGLTGGLGVRTRTTTVRRGGYELLESARNQGIANLRDIKLAILEPSGQFSFIKRSGDEEPQGAQEKHKA